MFNKWKERGRESASIHSRGLIYSSGTEHLRAHQVMKGLHFRPVTANRWSDFEGLFGSRGACGGCWCMVWRRKRAAWENGKGSGNKRAMKTLISHGRTPGIIAYSGKTPIGWCSIAPREDFVFLSSSRVLAPLDDANVWSVSCLFISKLYRRKGVSVELLRAAVSHAKRRGVKIVEGYPTIPYANKMPDAFAWTGTLAAFESAGFKEVARRSKSRPIVRFHLT
jgi:GNAT superfamily N-acetyltransferase